MAFLSCRKCGWEQDDFWHPEGYNPFRQDTVDWLKQCLFEPVVRTEEGGKPVSVNGRSFVAGQLERLACRIRGMKWPTEEEWMTDPNRWECPNCKANGLSVD